MVPKWDPSRFKAPPESGRSSADAALPPFDASDLVEGREDDSTVAGVLHRHGPALLQITGVQGYGEGRTPTGEDAVVVYLLDAASGAALPTELEGFPVLRRITGTIRAR